MHTPTPDQIKALRGSMSQSQFAKLIFVKIRTLQAYEQGINPMPVAVWELAKIVMQHPDAMMMFKDQM